MKKILSLILALTMMASLTVYSYAAVSDSVLENAFSHFEKLIDAESEARYIVAKDEINGLYTVIKDSAIKDYAELAAQMKDYADEIDSDIAPVFSNMDVVKDILSKFISENVINLDSLQAELQKSDSLDKALTLYTGAYIVKHPQKNYEEVSAQAATENKESTTANEETTQSTTNTAYQPPVVENPKTGDSSTGTFIAFAVLGVSIATIAVASKKKSSKEEE